MSVTTVLFDLDGTLLPMDQDVFVNDYFGRLAKKLAPVGYEPEKLIKGVISVKEENGLIQFDRFTEKQLESYKRIADISYIRAKCPAGVKMEFLTEEKNISFDFVTEGYCRDWLGFDVYENDRHEIYNELNKQEVYDNTLKFIDSII